MKEELLTALRARIGVKVTALRKNMGGSQLKKSSNQVPGSVECMVSTKEQNWRITITPA